uniref:Uncharacterized protein n=1 Tax=Rhizobium leguminosarum bv. trifolii TaxID=386 RepID=A0A1C9I102_RHILT|nr:hypothetical protein [Rhizobium leguminosarum bv. trifolii]
MTSVVLSCITGLSRIIWPQWNVSPVEKMEKDVDFIFVATQHNASTAHVAVHLNAQQHCLRDYSLLGDNYIRFPTQIDVFRDHLTSRSLRAGSILRRYFRLCQLMAPSQEAKAP